MPVNSSAKGSYSKRLRRSFRSAALRRSRLVRLCFSAFLCGYPPLAHSQQPATAVRTDNSQPEAARTEAASPDQQHDPQSSGAISGTVVDPTGAPVARARVELTRESPLSSATATSGDDGQFSFADVAPGPFRLTITAPGFAPQSFSGILHPGELCVVPQIALAIPAAVTQISVALTRVEVAEAEIKEEEKQRALGFVPNFYVTYVPNAAPLTTKQKFELAWKSTVDPVSFSLLGVVAGLQQAQNAFPGYGQGAAGYGRRYGAAFGDSVTSTFIGGALLPSVFKQDPRYFYKGTGSKRSRILYALANAVICKSDNGRWQANYSGILGGLASGAISNFYYPPGSRGTALVFENTLVGIGEGAVLNLFQEFVVRRFTPHLPPLNPAVTQSTSPKP